MPIPRYRVGEPLRRGLLGETFIGYADDGAPVALTRLDARWTGHPEMPRHLERAAARARDTPVPGTVAVRGVLPPSGPDVGTCYVVTEYVAAPTLDALLRRTGELPAPLALWLAESVAWALFGLVERRRSHGALDPATILCTERGPLLCEHSLVGPLNRAASRLGASGAAPTHPDFATRYLAPEVTQRTGWGGAAADVFSLGMILRNAVSWTSYPGGEELARLVAACVRPRAKGRPSVPKVVRLAYQARQAAGFTDEWARSEWAVRLAKAAPPDGGPVRIGGASGSDTAGSGGAVWSAGSAAAGSAGAGSGGVGRSGGSGVAGSGGAVWSAGSAAAGSAAAGWGGAGDSDASAAAGSAGAGSAGAGSGGVVWSAGSAGAGSSGASAATGSAGAGSGGSAAAGSAAAAAPGVLSPAEAAWRRRRHRQVTGSAGTGGRPGDRPAEPSGRQSGGSPSPPTAPPDSVPGVAPGSVEHAGRGPAYDESRPTAPESRTGRAPAAPASTVPGGVEHAGRGPAYNDSPSTAPESRRTGGAPPAASEPAAPASAAPASTRPAPGGPAPGGPATETGDLTGADPRFPAADPPFRAAESRPWHASRPHPGYGSGRGMRPFRAGAPRGADDPAARPLPDGGWTVDLGFLPDAPLAYADGVLYVAGADRDGGVLLAVDGRSGTRRWEFRAGGPYRARPVPYRGSVLLAGRDGVLYVLRAATGEVEASVAVDDPLGSAPAVVGDQVWLGGVSGLLQRVDLRDGTVRHVRPPGEPADVLAASALAGPGGLWLPTATGLHRLAADGSVFWSRPDLGDLNGCGITLDGGRLFGGTADGRVYACDAASGELLWETPAGAAVTGPPLVAGGAVHVGTSDGAEGAVRAYEPASGRPLAAVELPSAVTGPPVWAAGRVVAATRDRRLRALSAGNGHYAPGWSWRAGGRIGRCGPCAGDGLVFTGSSDCHLYAVAARDGTGGPPGALRIDPEIDAALTVLFNGAG